MCKVCVFPFQPGNKIRTNTSLDITTLTCLTQIRTLSPILVPPRGRPLQVFVPSWQLMSRYSSVSPLQEQNWWPLLHRRSSGWSAAEKALSLQIMESLASSAYGWSGVFIKAESGGFEGCRAKEQAIKYSQIHSLSFPFIEPSLQWLCGWADRL